MHYSDHWKNTDVRFDELVGKTLTSVVQEPERVTFVCDDGTEYQQYHVQDCCESVWVEEVVGDLDDLLFTPILMAEVVTNNETDEWGDSTTWTFYKLATVNGHVTIRWCGSSNGYYSESVDFVRVRSGRRRSASSSARSASTAGATR